MESHILKQLEVLCDIFNRPRFSDETASDCVKKLRVYRPDVINEAFESAKLFLEMPKLGELIEICRNKERRMQMALPQPERKFDTSSGALLAAIMSCLWLHYRFKWDEKVFQGSIFRAAFEKTFGKEQFNFEKLKDAFTREQVLKWFVNWERENGFASV